MIAPQPKGTSPFPAAGGNASQNESTSIRPPPGERPPSYGTQSYGPTVQPYPVVEEYIVIYRQPPIVRFCKAFVVATLIWLLLSAFIQSLVYLAHLDHRHGRWNSGWEDFVPADIGVECCVDWSNVGYNQRSQNASIIPNSFAYASKSTFELPLSSETLFLLSRGPLSAGVANVVLSNEIDRNTVKVDVVLNYSQHYIRQLVKVCEVVRKDGENGVGVFSSLRRPKWWKDNMGDEHAHVEITVTIPEIRAHGHEIINGFETDLPNTIQRLDDFAEKVNFKKLSLKGSNSAIIVKSVRAVDGSIKTSNGLIEGVFNATRSLVLHTSNSIIKADVGLLNDSKNSTKTELDMYTSNGLLESNISLLTPSKLGGNFKVTARTSNNAMQLSFPASPVHSVLELKGKTSNGGLTVLLNPTYEGKFSLSTSNSPSTVQQRKDVEDPSGKGRKRTVSRDITGRTTRGHVSWSEGGKNRGDVILTTSNWPISLEL